MVTIDEIVAYLYAGYYCAYDQNFADRIKSEGVAPPDGMMLVPIVPTAEMMRAAEEAYMPFGDMGMALICGNLAAAPRQENSND